MSDVLTTLRTERNRVAAEVNAGEKELARIDKAIAIFANGNGNRDVYAHNAALARAALAKQLAENGGTLAGHVHEAIGTFAHPIFFYELGENALIVEEGGRLVGFILGFLVFKAPKTGYIHLVGIHPDFRRKGVGRLLYEHFTERCRALGCLRMKAITTAGNEGSIRFHEALGWNVEEVEDYAGSGRKRIVFTKELTATN